MILINCVIDWTAISAIATLIMAFATFLTLWHSRKQLDEMRRQWSEEHQPVIESVIIKHSDTYCIQLINYGKGEAKNISISFDISSIKDIPKIVTERFNSIESQSYSLLPSRQVLIPIFKIISSDYYDTGKVNEVEMPRKDVLKIDDIMRKRLKFKVLYGDNHQYTEDFEVIGKPLRSPITTTIQEELSLIYNEINQYFQGLKKKENRG